MAQASEAPLVLAGRYHLGGILGSGGGGTVWRATDALTGGAVAVKVLSPLSDAARKQVQREVLAMRVLQVPGVVTLLDHGVHEGRPFLAMALVEGGPFPGPRFDGTWDSLAPTAMALLEILARIHAEGIVHRDLKPDNVLVDLEGRPTVLDLGLASGERLDSRDSNPSAGSPQWQAPEQLLGHAADARADLYALGVMLFEALAGQPPQPLADLQRLTFARLMRDAPPLASVAAGVPPRVAHTVDRLLQRDAERRPRSAMEVLMEIRGTVADGGRLPWLGPDRVAPLRDALLAGRSCDVVGARGSGRTRVADDVVRALVEAGRTVLRLPPGDRPFGSLQALQADVDAPDEGEMDRAVEARLRALLADRVVVVADDTDRLDPWSRALLHRCRDDGAVLRALPEGDEQAAPDALRLGPLDVDDLRPLFAGPDRFLHLQEDGARELYARTGGHPARVAEEVGRWVGAGLARWADGRVAVDRHTLERLGAGLRFEALRWDADAAPLLPPLEELLAWATLAWPHGTAAVLARAARQEAWEVEAELDELARVGAVRVLPGGRVEPTRAAPALEEWPPGRRRQAHARLAADLPPVTEGRLAHLIAAGDMPGAADEALALGAALSVEGRSGRALAVLGQGLAAARDAEDAARESRLLEALARVALAESTPAALKLARYEVERARGPLDGDAGQLSGLLRAWMAWMEGASALAVAAAAGDLAPFADEDLECWRRARELAAALRRGALDEADAIADAAEDWAERRGTGLARGRVLGWRGLVRGRQNDHAVAARLHEASIPLKTTIPDRLNAMLNAAMSWYESGGADDAVGRLAAEAEALARARRLANYEARAQVYVRLAALRRGGDLTPDPTLPDALAGLVGTSQVAMVCLYEGGLAWLTGDVPLARALASRSVSLYEKLNLPDGDAVARALLLLCTPGRVRTDVAPVLALVPRCTPECALNVLGVLALAFPVDGDPGWAAEAERHYARIPEAVRFVPWAVLSPAEALAHCRSLARRLGA